MGTVLMVASAGGHLAELFRLRARLPGADADTVWVSTDHPHSRSLLAGCRAHFVPDAPSRDWRAALRNARLLRPLLRELRPERVFSNGASVAVSVFVQAVLLGARADYVENSVRVRGPSLTGRLLRWVPGVRTHTQYRSWASRRWHFAGSVLDEWQPAAPAAVPALQRVVVTVGTEAWPFRALFQALVPLLPENAQVLWQHGSTEVGDLGLRGVHSLPAAELGAAMAEADLVVAHSGIGSAIAALDRGKAPLLVPRRAHRGEAVDDHQADIGEELARRGLCTFCEVGQLDAERIAAAACRRVARVAQVPPLDLGPP
ncbi:MAG: glycosyl transferase family 28 [Planctomycetes bacterium]|nr:glycosyl transferase family 28 [Planctomycetota bacterium]